MEPLLFTTNVQTKRKQIKLSDVKKIICTILTTLCLSSATFTFACEMS